MIEIYVASLTDYNNAEMHGVWINLDESTDLDEVNEQVEAMLKASPTVKAGDSECAEEYAIHDYFGFGDYRVDEYEPLPNVVAVAKGIDKHGDAFGSFLNTRKYCDESIDESLDNFNDRNLGVFRNAKEYAWQTFEECYPEASELALTIPGLSFSAEQFVRALEIDGYEFLACSEGVIVLSPEN